MLEVGTWMATSVFGTVAGQGNPMVVVRLQDWPDDQELHFRARELPAHEVTIVVQDSGGLVLRWFGPHGEVPFCGHGALAAAALLSQMGSHEHVLALGGPAKLPLRLGHEGDLAVLQMPATELVELEPSRVDLGVPILRLFDAGRDYLAVLPDEVSLRMLRPCRERLLSLNKIGVIMTAPTTHAAAVFRFFAPSVGIEEDRASCSVLPALGALWLSHPLDEGIFIQCSDIDIPMVVRRFDTGWQVKGRVHVTDHGSWVAERPRSPHQDTQRKNLC